jgi:hypothetical protein
MSWAEVWVWLWFLLGMLSYWLKRAYYGISPPSPVATGYVNYIQRSWAPLLVQAFLESLLFWILFTPGLADRLLAAIGWTSYGWAIQTLTTVAPAAALIGHAVDSITDLAVSKIPFIRDILPQMPGALPQPGTLTATITKQTTTNTVEVVATPPTSGEKK